MKIPISCLGTSAQYLPGGGKWEAEAGPEDTVEDILRNLGIPQELFMFALVRGERVDLSYRVRDGDEVVLVSPPAGG